jgi:ADP-ribose pyrophosphatase YjhB (NUDIX family)
MMTANLPDPPARIPCVGAVVHDEWGRLLLVRRANPPAAGTWSLPGGRVEAGESDAQAVVREVAEETGLVVEARDPVGSVERPAGPGRIYVINDLRCRVLHGHLTAGDDATDAGWFSAAGLDDLPLSPGLRETLAAWGELPS